MKPTNEITDSRKLVWLDKHKYPLSRLNNSELRAAIILLFCATFQLSLIVAPTVRVAGQASTQAAGNLKPVVSFSVLTNVSASVFWFILNASGSYDPDGYIVSYTWDFGDGSPWKTVASPVVNHFYEIGDYNITLTVTDNEGLTNTGTGHLFVVPGTSTNPLRISVVYYAIFAALALSVIAGLALLRRFRRDSRRNSPESQDRIEQVVGSPSDGTRSQIERMADSCEMGLWM